MMASPEHAPRLTRLIARARARFAAQYGLEPVGVVVAPGRVNLVGEHTDYNDGFVMPMAIDRFVVAAFRAREDDIVRAWAEQPNEQREASIGLLSPATRTRSWFDYVAGAAWSLRDAGLPTRGADLTIVADLAIGAGLSSSAALEVAAARAVVECAGAPWDPMQAARLTQRSEDQYVGLSCGIMDQVAVACARAGHALLLDCRALTYDLVALPSEAAIVVMDTGVRRRLVDSAYQDRAAACARAVAAVKARGYDVSALRDIDRWMLSTVDGVLDSTTAARARHVVEEMARPGLLAQAFRQGDLPQAGAIMNASHESLRDLYEVSSAELDHMVAAARAHEACFGARMTGAGFGGCAIALVRPEGAERFMAEVSAAYAAAGGPTGQLFRCAAVEGVRIVSGAGVADASSDSGGSSELSGAKA